MDEEYKEEYGTMVASGPLLSVWTMNDNEYYAHINRETDYLDTIDREWEDYMEKHPQYAGRANITKEAMIKVLSHLRDKKEIAFGLEIEMWISKNSRK